MAEEVERFEKVPSFCALCISRCGAIATIKDGRFTGLEADPAHPTGQALCIKGKVAPELVYHPDRLTHPIKRTNPKGDVDPGWKQIGWDEALSVIAERLEGLAKRHGPETVVFTNVSPSTSALCDSVDWLRRLRKVYGSPNQAISMELCGWGRYLAICIPMAWGYQPTVCLIWRMPGASSFGATTLRSRASPTPLRQ